MTDAPHDMVVGVSIKPRTEDREQATLELLTMLLNELDHETVAELMIRQQSVIIQAERLEAKAVNAIVDRGDVV